MDIEFRRGELQLPDTRYLVVDIVDDTLIIGGHRAEKAEQPRLEFGLVGLGARILVAEGVGVRLCQGLAAWHFLVALVAIGGCKRLLDLLQHRVFLRRRRSVAAACRHRVLEIGLRRLQGALVDEDRAEWRFLDLGVDLAQRIATGKDIFAAVLGCRPDGDRNIGIDAAGGTVFGHATGFDFDGVGAVIAFDEGAEILRRLGFAEIVPGAREFLPVDGAVERADDRFGVRPVVDIGRFGGEHWLAWHSKGEKSGRCKKGASHRESPPDGKSYHTDCGDVVTLEESPAEALGAAVGVAA
ncbi:hypothetical protein BQ8482_340069 [Mesorhizobium delmotii]|uniref:Uncharacterized protein n=1 Tax=Mesorhizobium delmotii TaxID=1631247 RepID=A0A2P9APT0_9HYPH|nr:hypothetical protein BQ8482_340069 [Mesorhizobium delmotii]